MLIFRRFIEKKNIDKSPRHFDVLFRCNIDGRKIDVVSMYIVRRNFDEQNIDVELMWVFFRPNFDGRKVSVVSVYFLVQFRWKTDEIAYFDVILKD